MFCDVEKLQEINIIVAFVSLCVSRVRNRGAPTAVMILVYEDDLFKLKKTKIIERDEQIHQDAFLLGAALKNTVCSSKYKHWAPTKENVHAVTKKT